eukprot:scaffold11837_cov124-Skeletonema_menzelii.AAC.3
MTAVDFLQPQPRQHRRDLQAIVSCVQDCVGAPPFGGLAEGWDEPFVDKQECCENKLWWNKNYNFVLSLSVEKGKLEAWLGRFSENLQGIKQILREAEERS